MNMLFCSLDNVGKAYGLHITSSPNCKLMDIMTYTKFKIIVLDILWKVIYMGTKWPTKIMKRENYWISIKVFMKSDFNLIRSDV